MSDIPGSRAGTFACNGNSIIAYSFAGLLQRALTFERCMYLLSAIWVVVAESSTPNLLLQQS